MENHLSHLLLCFFFFSVHVFSQPYTPPDKFFLNCGSPTTVVDDAGRNFIGDTNFGFRSKSSRSREVNHATNSPSLNNSVRIFNQFGSYEFEIDQDVVHIVRLHFYPLNFLTDLSTALFDVSANEIFLMKNVTATGSFRDDSASIKEFLLRLKPGKFRVYFLPLSSSSIAYVNAIEVFPTPPNFIPSEARENISGTRTNLSAFVLHTIYRINVGDSEIPTNRDELWRKWELDDNYILNPSSAITNKSVSSQKLQYMNENDEYFASDFVYKTAKEISSNMNSSSSYPNITWSFSLRKHTLHLLRVHFYDFIAITSDGFLVFNFSIGNGFSQKVPPEENRRQTYPFHLDFLVDSGEIGFVNVSVSPLGHVDSGQASAFLNGIEIMETMDEHSEDPIDETKNKEVGLFVGLGIGGFGLLCVLGCVIFCGLKWRKSKIDQETSHSHTRWSPLPVFGGGSVHSRFSSITSSSSSIANLSLGLKFSLAEIKTATNNFNKKFLIGEGGFGKVYKGVVRNNMKVAVKRSEPGAGQGISEFEREITILSRIRHRHLVSFIGYCDEGLEMILIYELLEKGTLREHLYSSSLPPLPWKKRLEICIDSARGLHYLHTGSSVGGIIHRDVKSTNILLDENLVAKVSDFGLSTANSLDETHVSTDIKGTFGYLDPVYFRTQQLTEKSDVYSFGVLLLEVLCARPALDTTLEGDQRNLAEWGLKCMRMELLEDIIDPKLKGQIDPNSLRKFSDTIERCLQDDSADRPTMADVLWDLEYALQLQQGVQHRMPHEDSETNAYGASSIAIQRIPSTDSTILRDGNPDMSQDRSKHSATEFFSQLKADDGR